MKAAIYIRTWRHDKGHHAYSLQKQEQQAQELAIKHGLAVGGDHVFSDIDYAGDSPPSCWVFEDDQKSRPALAALIEAVESGVIKRVIVRKMERLSSAANTLIGLLEVFTQHGVFIVATPENETINDDPAEAFAVSILRPRIRYDTDEDRDRKIRQKAKNIEEILRLQERISRLESEIADFDL